MNNHISLKKLIYKNNYILDKHKDGKDGKDGKEDCCNNANLPWQKYELS